MPHQLHKSEDFYCISWVADHRGRSAWQVKVARQGIRATRSFSPSRHGGKAAALLAARAWRDQVLKQLPPMTNRQLRTVVRRNNTSGIPGVWRIVRGNAVRWQASLSRSGQKALCASFSVAEFGEEGARQRAIEARHTFLQQQTDRFYALSPSSQALCVRDFGDAEQLTGGAMPLAWNPQIAQRQLDRLRQTGLLPAPGRTELVRRDYPSTGPTWEATVKQADGRRKVRRFRVERYGEEEARRLAEEALAGIRSLQPIP